MPKCSQCGFDKPKDEVYLGKCDDCFHGRTGENVSHPVPPQSLSNEHIIMTTSIDVPNRTVDEVISIVASEAALGMNIFKDIANNWRDFVGGRSSASQASLKEARLACLDGLRSEAMAVGADAVIAVDLDYNQLATGGAGGILFVAATGTAVKLKANT
ncbi:YbjQ family protein [Agrobacterium pusense]|uniref:YbjQ family protein n=1 Tax=Agrobacterium pusense TaxID=648995 RepID=UPI00345F0A18